MNESRRINLGERPPAPWRQRLLPLAVAACFFAAVAPTLSWVQFVNGSEDTVVATALEIRRGGPWWVPQLFGEPRTKKPPVAAWAAAAGITPGTVSALRSPDFDVRDAAFRRLAWQARWTALLAACALLAALCAFGQVLGDWRLGFAAALACGSGVMFLLLRFIYLPTTDIHLALWVTVANLGFASALLGRSRWAGCLVGGVGLGLALMSKGPVALVQTVLPLVLFAAWRRWATHGPERQRTPRRSLWVPLLTAALIALVIGLTWYVTVLLRMPDVLNQWTREVTREGATENPPSPWYNYLLIVPLAFPWTLFLICGLIDAARAAWRRDLAAQGMVLALCLLVVPVVVMSFFRDREVRYLLPMFAPAALLAAGALVRSSASRSDLLTRLHWTGLTAFAVALPLMGATGRPEFFRTAGGAPWYAWPVAAGLVAVCLLFIIGALAERRRGAAAVAVATAGVMLTLNVAYQWGYARTPDGQSEFKTLADAIWLARPDATVYSYRTDRPVRHAPRDLEIYLNRPVYRLADLAGVPPAAESPERVVVVAERSDRAPPAIAGWTAFAHVTEKKLVWYAYAPSLPKQQ